MLSLRHKSQFRLDGFNLETATTKPERINENKGTPDVPAAVSFFFDLRPTLRLAILAFLVLLCASINVKPVFQGYKGIII